MRKTLTVVAATLMASSSWHTFAASSVDLTVTGLITPSACTPGLSGGGVVDHGKISAKDLSATDQTLLPASTLQMVVNCDAQTLFALKGIENSVGSTNPNGFGLGLINGNQPLGHYTLELLNASADTAAATTLKSVDDGKTWDAMGGDVWSTLNLASFGNQSGGNWAPIPIKDLTADLKVSTLIAPASELDLTNEVPIDGSATLEVKYL